MWIVIVCGILMIIFLIGGLVFFNLAVRKDSKLMNGSKGPTLWEGYEQQQAYIQQQSFQEVSITSKDGLKLVGYYYPQPNAKRTILCAHGYHGSPTFDFSNIFHWLHENNNLLMIDQRCCGKSEGEFITFGAKESQDVLLWLDWLHQQEQGKNPVYLYGISLGSSTVSICAKAQLPKEVKGILADCGYTSMFDICTSLAWRWFHLPAFPLVWFIALWCKLIGHFSMFDADAKKALQHATVPVLFLDGTDDTFVLPDNSQKNYDACSSEKELVWIEGASHAMAYMKNPSKYENAVTTFFQKTEGIC